LIFRWYVTSLANFKSARGSLGGIFVLTTYLYVAGIVLLVGIELDELLRADLSPGEAGPGIVDFVRRLFSRPSRHGDLAAIRADVDAPPFGRVRPRHVR